VTELPASLFVYRNAWNEPEVGGIRPLLVESLAADCLFVDPAHTCTGVDEIEAMIREFRTTFPTSRYDLTSGVDGHNQRYRYRWIAQLDAGTAVEGMDVTTVNAAGQIERIDGFFGDFDPLPPS
jgi:hypothetical protein